MMNPTQLIMFLCLVYLPHTLGQNFRCYSCKSGYTTSEPCSNELPSQMWFNCTGQNAQCYESIQWFQNGALRLVIRDCWQPTRNASITDFCQGFNDPNAQLVSCTTCRADLCNDDPIYQPNNVTQCQG